jgi:periplasmic protein TonB
MKPLLLISLNVCFLTSFAQDKNQFYALDAKMNQTVLDSSKYILWVHQKEDSNWQWDYYKTWGPMIKSTSYADHDGKILNGPFYFYNATGNLDSTGDYDRGKKSGSFSRFRSSSRDSNVNYKEYVYEKDSLVKTIDHASDRNRKDNADTANSKESEYPGGQRQWYYYLAHNLKYPERAINKEIQGQVEIGFVVDENGNVKDPYIHKSVEYSLDQASIKLIKDSGKWDPGVKNGVNVKSFKVQPVIFKLESQ